MTHRGPFQPLPFCDSVILSVTARDWWNPGRTGEKASASFLTDAVSLKTQHSIITNGHIFLTYDF